MLQTTETVGEEGWTVGAQSGWPRRVAMISAHTSPLEAPGSGDAGGMNVYVAEVARRLGRRGITVDVFSRARSAVDAGTVELERGVRVRQLPVPGWTGSNGTGPDDIDAALLSFADTVGAERAGYDLVHAHYWMSGVIGARLSRLWRVPLAYSAHTLGRVKDLRRGRDEQPEPASRIEAEDALVRAADRLIAATEGEAGELVDLYDADPSVLSVVEPGVDLAGFSPGDRGAARQALDIDVGAMVLAFVGRVQPHKAPDLLIRAAALLPEMPGLVVLIIGGRSGRSYRDGELPALVDSLGLGPVVRFVPPVSRHELVHYYRATDLLVMPSRSESFGLAALEAQACGVPVIGTRVGGLSHAVSDGRSGLLVDGHDPADLAAAIAAVIADPALLRRLRSGALAHAAPYSWERTADGLLAAYAGARDHHAGCGSCR